jgi:large subunit ribosomal protein L19
MNTDLIRSLEPSQPSTELPAVRPGDTVRVEFRIVEGSRERVQPFQGVIIRMAGRGAASTITVRRIAAHGIGVERTFPLFSPRLESLSLLRSGHARRARLYFLRRRTGKAARLRDSRRRRPTLAGEPDLDVEDQPTD